MYGLDRQDVKHFETSVTNILKMKAMINAHVSMSFSFSSSTAAIACDGDVTGLDATAVPDPAVMTASTASPGDSAALSNAAAWFFRFVALSKWSGPCAEAADAQARMFYTAPIEGLCVHSFGKYEVNIKGRNRACVTRERNN